MNNSEIEALLQHKKTLQRLILIKDGVVEAKKHKRELQIIEDLLYYDRYTKGVR